MLGSPTVPAAGSIVSGVRTCAAHRAWARSTRRRPCSTASRCCWSDKRVSGLSTPTFWRTRTHVLRVDALDRVGNAGWYTVSVRNDRQQRGRSCASRAWRTVLARTARGSSRTASVRSRLGRRRCPGCGVGTHARHRGRAPAHPPSVRPSWVVTRRASRGLLPGQHGGCAADRARRGGRSWSPALPESWSSGYGARAPKSVQRPAGSCARCTSAVPPASGPARRPEARRLRCDRGRGRRA